MAGAAIASLVAVAVGSVWLSFYFVGKTSYLTFVRADWKPQIALWRKMLGIGLPAGAEFALVGVYLFVVYIISRPFGAAAQAGFGIGMRIIQAGFMPVVALGFAVAPVAGQNFGARHPQRVRDTFQSAALMAAGAMVLWSVVCMVAGESMIRVFSDDPQVVAIGDEYLHIVAWTFAASGVIFVGSSMFQAMGNTLPALVGSIVRIVVATIPAFLLSRLPGFALHWIWYLSVVAITVQLFVNLLMLRREFNLRLNFATVPIQAEPGLQA